MPAFTSRSPHLILAAAALHDPGAAAAVETAGVFAAALGAEVLILGVAPFARPAPSLDDPVIPLVPPLIVDQQDAIDRLTRRSAAEAEQLLPRSVARRTALAWGSAGPAIVEAARTEAADLVVVPMRREHALDHLLHDRADRYVLHHSDVPVVVVPVDPRHGENHSGAPTTAAA